MKSKSNELNRYNGKGMKKSEELERYIQQVLCKEFKLEPGHITTGNSPEYDLSVFSGSEEYKIELKVSNLGRGVCNTDFLLEYARADGITPSGISLSTAYVYMIITPGYTNNSSIKEELGVLPGDKVGKVRLYLTEHLHKLKEISIRNGNTKTFADEVDENGKIINYGTTNAVISWDDLKTVSDLCLFDCSAILDNDGYYEFNLANRYVYPFAQRLVKSEKWLDDKRSTIALAREAVKKQENAKLQEELFEKVI